MRHIFAAVFLALASYIPVYASAETLETPDLSNPVECGDAPTLALRDLLMQVNPAVKILEVLTGDEAKNFAKNRAKTIGDGNENADQIVTYHIPSNGPDFDYYAVQSYKGCIQAEGQLPQETYRQYKKTHGARAA